MCYRVSDEFRRAVWFLIRRMNHHPKEDVMEKSLKAVMNFLDKYFIESLNRRGNLEFR